MAPKNLTPADLAKWVDAHSDYVYVAAGATSSAGADEIMLYEKPGDHGKDGMNILFGDGHVEFVLMGKAVAMIQDQNKTVPAVDLPDVPEK